MRFRLMLTSVVRVQFASVHEHSCEAAVPASGGLCRQATAKRQAWQGQRRRRTSPATGGTRPRVVPVVAIRQPRPAKSFELLEHAPAALIEGAAVERDSPPAARLRERVRGQRRDHQARHQRGGAPQ